MTQVDALDLSPDGRWLLAQRVGRGKRAPLVVLSADTLEVRSEFGRGLARWSGFTTAGLVAAAFDGDGGDPHLEGFDLDGRQASDALADPAVRARQTAPAGDRVLHADAQQVFVARTDAVHVLRADGHAAGPVLPVPDAAALRVAGGHWWVRAAFGRGVFVFDDQGTPVARPSPLNDDHQTVTAFDITVDGERLLIGNAAGHVRTHRAASGELTWGERLHRGHVTAVRWSADSRLAFSGGADGDVCVSEPS